MDRLVSRTYLVLAMRNLVKVRQSDFRRVTKAFLRMLARYRNVGTLEPPPVRKSLAVVQARVTSAFALFPTVDGSIVTRRNPNLQGVAIDFELTLHAIPSTRIVLVLHPVPIFALFVVRLGMLTHVALHINGRLTMDAAVSCRAIFRAPFAIITHVINLPIKEGVVGPDRRELVGKTSLQE